MAHAGTPEQPEARSAEFHFAFQTAKTPRSHPNRVDGSQVIPVVAKNRHLRRRLYATVSRKAALFSLPPCCGQTSRFVRFSRSVREARDTRDFSIHLQDFDADGVEVLQR
jgi:hypothetical protein